MPRNWEACFSYISSSVRFGLESHKLCNSRSYHRAFPPFGAKRLLRQCAGCRCYPIHQSRPLTLARHTRADDSSLVSIRAAASVVPSWSLQMSSINSRPPQIVRLYTPGPPDTSNNFLNEQISKQQRSNFHSTSLRSQVTMVANNVNKTALHPRGVE